MLPHPIKFLLSSSLLLPFAGTAFADQAPVAHYLLDGDAREHRAAIADGMLVGGAPTADRFGKTDGALRLGRDCSVHIPTAAFRSLGSSDFSVSFWFSAARDMSRPGSTLLRSTTRNQGRHGVTLWFGDAEATPVPFSIGAEVWSGGQNAYARNDAPLNDDKWHHVALVRQGDAIRFYIDGVPALAAESEPLGTPVLLGESLILGNGHDPYDDFFRNRFVGAFDDLRIYGSALNPDDVAALFTAPSP